MNSFIELFWSKKEELGSSQRFFRSRTLAGFPQSSAMAVKEEMLP